MGAGGRRPWGGGVGWLGGGRGGAGGERPRRPVAAREKKGRARRARARGPRPPPRSLWGRSLVPHAVFGIAARVSGRVLRCPVPRGPAGRRGGWRRGSGAPSVSPPCPGRRPRRSGRGPLLSRSAAVRSGARAAAQPPLPAGDPGPLCPVGAARAEAESRAGLRPGDACPGGGPRDAAASPAAARFPPGCGRAALRAPSPRCRGVWGGVGSPRGVSVAGGVPRRPPGPVRGRGGSARGAWDVCGGRPGASRGGKRAGGRGRPPRSDPPHARARFPPSLPRPAPLAAVPPPGSSRGGASRASGPARPPVPRPPPSAFQPRQGSRLCRRPVLPPARPPFRRVRPACAHPTFPVPPPLPALSPPALSLSLSLPPSLAEGLEGRGFVGALGGGSSVGGRAARASLGCFASLGVGRRTGRVRTAASSRGPAFRSSRRPSALASRGSSWRARSRARPSETRPQIRRGDPLNLSILVSGGKETNEDSLSNGE